jgi:hypothetical protein
VWCPSQYPPCVLRGALGRRHGHIFSATEGLRHGCENGRLTGSTPEADGLGITEGTPDGEQAALEARGFGSGHARARMREGGRAGRGGTGQAPGGGVGQEWSNEARRGLTRRRYPNLRVRLVSDFGENGSVAST